MKRLILFGLLLITSISLIYSQTTPVKTVRIEDATTEMGESLSVGCQVYNLATDQLWVVQTAVSATASLTNSAASFSIVNGDGSTDLAESGATTTTVQITSSTGNPATLQMASETRAGLMPAVKHNQVEANNAKITNANHTGDVTGSLALSIGDDRVDVEHINWGIGANQVSTAAIPESGNLWYTDARVSANSAVVANTAKTGITSQQSTDITNNNAKVSYSDAAIVASNSTHRTTNTGNPHNVSKSDVGLSAVPNTDFTSAVNANTAKVGLSIDGVNDSHINWGTSASQVNTGDIPESGNLWYTNARVSSNTDVVANTAKTGITAGQASAIVANTSKISYTDAAAVGANSTHRGEITGNPHSVNKSDVGLGNVPNTDFTDDVAANTAKTGISAQQASDITSNNAKVTNQSTILTLGTRTATTIAIDTDGGTADIILPAATSTQAGLMTEAQYDKLNAIEPNADQNFTLYTETFTEDDGTATAHSLEFTAQAAGAVVAINGSVLAEDKYSLTTTTITVGVPVLQYDIVTITYNY